MSRVDSLDANALRAALGDQLIGNRIVLFEETSSTNDIVAQMAPENEEGLVVIAERQTAGRGQYGRRWESAAGKGIWLSVLLRPKIALADSARVTDLLAQTIADTLRERCAINPTIKPPNDIYVAGRKLAGVLVEMRVENGGDYFAIAGLGLNVNHAPDDFPPELRETAASLAMIAKQTFDRHALIIALLRNLDVRYRDWRMP